MEYWSDGRRGIYNCIAGGQEKTAFFLNHNMFQRFLFIAFPILHYSSTPILPQKDSYINNPLPGVTQSRALWTRIFT